ncbi:MAG: CheR family methyltransferase [Actinomycetota bacterium]
MAAINEPRLVVAIGASAGGLAPLQEFFSATPAETGFSYIVAQHLSPDHATVMDALLARQTSMPVVTATDEMQLEADTVYLLPPASELRVETGRLRVNEQVRLPGVAPHPIDVCFASLADAYGAEAVAIVMSGTGDDGTAGVRAVHDAGGLAIVQDASARFTSMPISADRTGAVDRVLAAADMPTTIARYARDPDEARHQDLDGYAEYGRILSALGSNYGLDFNAYKIGTVRRRIERRRELAGISDIDKYTRLVENDEHELRALYDDLLIGVTSFFRDPSVWEHLASSVVPTVVADAQRDDREIRSWVAACATGEEAYSLAIVLLEHLRRNDLDLPIRIFATDADQRSLATASAGLYDADALTSLPADVVERYFEGERSQYRVKPALRRCVTFSAHNVLRDAPFTRVDLLSCRNLLIYLRPEAQHQTLRFFHFALRVDGYLVLGQSESVEFLTDEFEEIGPQRVYRKLRNTAFVSGPSSFRPPRIETPVSPRGAVNERLIKAYDSLLESFAPPAFLVDENRNLLHTFGAATTLLRQPGGRTRHDLLDLLDDNLRVPVWGALQRAQTNQRTVRLDSLLIDSQDPTTTYSLEVRPIAQRDGPSYSLVVVTPTGADGTALSLEGAEPRQRSVNEGPEDEAQARHDISILERELQITRESLQTTIEELEASNEELIASNEELQSTNEELQSVNEELHTVNSEYEAKITELSQLTADMDNLLESTEIGTLFLDPDLNVRRYTPALAQYIKLRPQDIGRPVGDIVLTLDLPTLHDDALDVIETGETIVREVHGEDAEWLLVRLTPYRAADEQIEGVVVSVVDIASLREAQLHLEAVTRRFEAFMQHSPALKWALDAHGRYVFANDVYRSRLGVDVDDIVGLRPADVLTPETETDLHGSLADQVGTSLSGLVQDEVEVHVADDALNLLTNVFPYVDADGPVQGGSALDITDLRQAEAGVERHRRQLAEVLDRIPALVWLIGDDRSINLLNGAAQRELDRPTAEIIGSSVDELYGDRAEAFFGPPGTEPSAESRLVGPAPGIDGTFRIDSIAVPPSIGLPAETIVMATDVSDLIRIQQELATMNSELEQRNIELDQFAHLASHDLRAPLRAIHAFGQMALDDVGESENINRVLAGVERMRRMLDSLLAYAESGRQTLSVVETDLGAVMDAVLEDLSADINASNAVVEVDDLPHVVCDPVQFRALFQNLVQNAIQYAGDDPPHIEVTAAVDGEQVALEFRDHGIGFDQGQADDVFEPFRRLDPSSSGQGIGLAICRRIVERHGGRIWARSEASKGAQFSIRVPGAGGGDLVD